MNYIYLVTQREGNKTLYNTLYRKSKDAKRTIALTTHWLKTTLQNFKIYYTENEEEDFKKTTIKIYYCYTSEDGYKQGEIIYQRKYIY